MLKVSLFCATISLIAIHSAHLSAPGIPQILNDKSNLITPTVIGGNENGRMVAWAGGQSEEVYAIFTPNNGNEWGPVRILDSTPDLKFYPWVSAGPSGFLVTWVEAGQNVSVVSRFYDNSSGWNNQSELFTASTPSWVTWPISASNQQGYLVVFVSQASTPSCLVQFSSNGTTFSNATSLNLGQDGGLPVVAGNDFGFMVVWYSGSQNDNFFYSSLSTDEGDTWSQNPYLVANLNVTQPVRPTIAANENGFMVAWTNNSNDAYASFFQNGGSTWSEPYLIAQNLLSGTVSNVTLSGTSLGFVASWIDAEMNGYASFSSDNGITWSTPVLVTGNRSVSNAQTIQDDLVGVSAVQDQCMFIWTSNIGQNQNYPLFNTATIISPLNSNGSTFYKQISPLKPNKGLF
jgi:hypothetical protein